jgi:hypothetical protein
VISLASVLYALAAKSQQSLLACPMRRLRYKF